MSLCKHGPRGGFFFAGLAAACIVASAPAFAQSEEKTWYGPGHWRMAVSPYSLHWRPSDEHRSVYAIGLERQRDDGWLGGASYFRNSFGQPSAYLYVGKRWDGLFDRPQLFGQLSGGLLYGYRGKFEDKVPLNNNGFSPGALATIGWQFNRQYAVALHALGDAGVMFQLSFDLR
jgi:hypothetical protein